MLTFLRLAVCLLALADSSRALKQAKSPKNAILLSNVKSLTLRADAKTSHRRLPAIPQLKCTGPGCKHHQVDLMRCTNQGADYEREDIQWSCTAQLPAEFKLGSTDVLCEGYDSPDDTRVLKGSCGVEYRLLLTEKGEERYGSGGSWIAAPEGAEWGRYLFAVLFVGVLVWILYAMAAAYRDPQARRPVRRGGGWGGGGWGGGDDPPPPYPGSSPYLGKRYGTGTREAGQGGWRPGFWSGALGGAAAGYMAGNRGGRQQQMQPEVPRSGGWFGGNNNGNRYTERGSSRSSSGSGRSTRYEGTGFGSTTRR